MLRTRAGLAAVLLLSLAALAGCGQVSTVHGTAVPVAIAPTITSQPASQVVSSGEQASFSVVAQGSDPLGYQWSRNGMLIDGAAAPTYTTAATESDDGAAFSVVVSNPAGTVESETAKLTVNPVTVAPSIVTQPSRPDDHRRAERDLQRRGLGDGSAGLPVAEERRGDRRRHCSDLHHRCRNDRR